MVNKDINDNFFPEENENLKEAVNEWFRDKDEAKNRYGDISTWNVSNITNTKELFQIEIGLMKSFKMDVSQ